MPIRDRRCDDIAKQLNDKMWEEKIAIGRCARWIDPNYVVVTGNMTLFGVDALTAALWEACRDRLSGLTEGPLYDWWCCHMQFSGALSARDNLIILAKFLGEKDG